MQFSKKKNNSLFTGFYYSTSFVKIFKMVFHSKGDKLKYNFWGYVKALILLNFHFNSFAALIAVIKLAFEEVRT